MTQTFAQLPFQKSFYGLGDPFFANQEPQPISTPYLISSSTSAAALIKLDPQDMLSEDFLAFVSGNKLHPEWSPLATVYAGHQFGGYSPRLGDGRALLLTEVKTESSHIELTLKGSGATPFSRQGDGRAVLRSSIREFLCSEAMAHLGIPTTRALSLVGSDDTVYREKMETTAMVLRMSPCHIRFGSFEYFCNTEQHEELQKLINYTIEHHFPAIEPGDTKALFQAVLERTAKLIAQWQSVGFCHGVMNTDNMSIIGETFDYGPFAFMDDFDPEFICNHSDSQGRYSYKLQEKIGMWNCCRLAESLRDLVTVPELNQIIQTYPTIFKAEYLRIMRAKLGLYHEDKLDEFLIEKLMELLAETRADFTIFFRALSDFKIDSDNNQIKVILERQGQGSGAWDHWQVSYKARLKEEARDESERQKEMKLKNPKFILRNYLLQETIEKAEEKDFSMVNTLLEIIQKPFDEQAQYEEYAKHPPDWGKKLSISCSS